MPFSNFVKKKEDFAYVSKCPLMHFAFNSCIMRIEKIEKRGTDMERKKADYRLGAHAKRLLLIVFPLIILQLVVLIAILMPLEGSELIKNEELIYTIFDGIGRGLIFMLSGTVILDYLEKKHRKKEKDQE